MLELRHQRSNDAVFYIGSLDCKPYKFILNLVETLLPNSINNTFNINKLYLVCYENEKRNDNNNNNNNNYKSNMLLNNKDISNNWNIIKIKY